MPGSVTVAPDFVPNRWACGIPQSSYFLPAEGTYYLHFRRALFLPAEGAYCLHFCRT
ncbi:MAG: hypothetical protein AAF623_08035 [Planctomycetota bacterium]